MSTPDFFAIGCACLGVVGGVLITITVTLAHSAGAAIGPPWLQALGVSVLQFEIALAIVFAGASVLAFAEDELSRNERAGHTREAQR